MENTTPKANTTKPMSENAQKVLATLKAEVSPMTTAELAAAAGVSAAAVTGSVQGLNKRGLIKLKIWIAKLMRKVEKKQILKEKDGFSTMYITIVASLAVLTPSFSYQENMSFIDYQLMLSF